MKKKKDFTKFTKRNTHKRRSKEQARRELMKAVRETNVNYDGVKIRDIDLGRGRDIEKSRNITARGIYSGSKSSYGFVTLETGERDIFIPGGSSRGAIDGDFVEIVYHKYRSLNGEEKTEGRVVKIVEIGRRTVIGTLCEELRRHGRRYFRSFYIQPDDAKISTVFPVRDLGGARLGEKIAKGELPDDTDWLGGIVRDVSFNNANEYFGFNA